MSEDLKYELYSDELSTYDLSFKIIIIGNSGVGKSCLTMRGTKNYFEDFYSPTVGFEFLVFSIKIEDKNIKLQIWDTCGQEVYRSLISSFYRNASLAMIVYSIDDENSFKDIELWLNDIKSQASPDIKLFLIGNKVDLEDKRKIAKENAENISKINGFNYFIETSAKTGFNAQNVFIQAAKILYKEHLNYKDRMSRPGSIQPKSYVEDIPNSILLDDEEELPRKKKKCC